MNSHASGRVLFKKKWNILIFDYIIWISKAHTVKYLLNENW